MSNKTNHKMRRMIRKGCHLSLKGATLMVLGALAIGMLTMAQLDSAPVLPQKISAEQTARYGPAEVPKETEQGIIEAYRNMPLAFILNAGQIDSRVRYYGKGSGYGFYFTPDEVVFVFVQKAGRSGRLETGTTESIIWSEMDSGAQEPIHGFDRLETQHPETGQSPREVPLTGFALALRFLGMNPEHEIEGRQELAGKVNYFISNDKAAWRTGLSTYQEVVYNELWPGVDVAFRGENGQLKYEFILQPGAKVEDIKLAFEGPDDVALDQAGNLLMETPIGVLIDERPWSYQQIGGKQVPVESRYVLEHRADGESVCGFKLGEGYDPHYPLVIDPKLVYSTFLGGSGNDEAFDIVVDDSGNAYVTGIVGFTEEFPITAGVFDPTFNGGFQDMFITKLNAAGTSLVYSTFLGGSGLDRSFCIAVDAIGNVYMTGFTESFDFPTSNAFDETCGDGSSISFGACHDAFVTKLDADGGSLLYSTYLGGSNNDDCGRDISVDESGNAYVTGDTQSMDFPTLSPLFIGPPADPVFDGGSPNIGEGESSFRDAFVVKFDTNGSPIFSTLLGGSSVEHGLSIAVDASGNAYVTGDTISKDFPTTDGAFDTSKSDVVGVDADTDTFVAKLGFNGSAELLYSTYLGGSDEDFGRDIDVDSAGNAYVTGVTHSPDFPTTAEAFDPTDNVSNDAFVVKLDANGANLIYSTYLGGSGEDEGNSIAIDGSGNVYVTGRTLSSDFPVTDDAFDLPFSDLYVTVLNTDGTDLVFGTFLGGTGGFDVGNGIIVDKQNNVYVTGKTNSTDFPITGAAFDITCGTDGLCNLGFDAFVVKLALASTPIATPTPIPTLTPIPTQIPIPTPSVTLEATTITLDPTMINRSLRTHMVIVTVLDQNGQPLNGVIVNAIPEGRRAAVTPSSATTSADGTASFECRFGLVTENGNIIFSADGVNATLTQGN